MTEFPENSAFERGRHKFTSNEELQALKEPYARLAQEVNVALIRRALEDLHRDVLELEIATEGEGPEEYFASIGRRLAEIIDDLN